MIQLYFDFKCRLRVTFAKSLAILLDMPLLFLKPLFEKNHSKETADDNKS